MSDAIPIACTLNESAVDVRLDEWNRALRRAVVAIERPGPQQLHLALAEDPTAVGELLVLARAEKECCPFFDFTCEIEVDGIRLVVAVPMGAVGVLDGFEALASPGIR